MLHCTKSSLLPICSFPLENDNSEGVINGNVQAAKARDIIKSESESDIPSDSLFVTKIVRVVE
jgi:hypothetical protein